MSIEATVFVDDCLIMLTGLDRPIVREFDRHVRDEVATRWHDLGVQLGISTKQLAIINTNYHGNVQMCCTKMFIKWLEIDNTASWNELIKALEIMKYNALVKTIHKEILQGTVTLCLKQKSNVAI